MEKKRDKKEYENICYAGTFDRLHVGHKEMLEKAFKIAKKVSIGIISDKMAKKKFLGKYIEKLDIRCQMLERYLREKKYISRAKIFILNDIYGPSVLSDNPFDSILVTKNTAKNAGKINKIRQDKKLKPLKIIVEPVIKGNDGKEISSERVRYGEIDRGGNPTSSSFAGLRGARKKLNLPQEMRDELRKPLGNIFENTNQVIKFIKSIKSKTPMIIAVGDIIVSTLIQSNFEPDVKIVDFRSRRKELHETFNMRHITNKRFINEPGTINIKAANSILTAVKNFYKTGKKQLIIIKGEEDLLALPAILFAPLGSVVLYGQWNLGIVVVEVSEDKKKEIDMILRRFHQCCIIHFMSKYQPKEFEKKWQEQWKKEKIFSPDLDKASKPYYALMMFPYPSAEGLHVGNMYAFTGTDIFARYMRMQGYDVFEPIGLDGFGIHSENYAIKVNKHPAELSKITEKRFYQQLMSIGNAFDWTRTVETYKPDYYKWTQWIFLQMYKNGLAYRKKAEVNWCPSCKTVLADEQVISGRCERCSTLVVKKMLEQWFFKITKYAERLLKNLDKLDWSEKVLTAQRNWIGKKEGVLIKHEVEGMSLEIVTFSAYPAWFWADTFIVITPEHPIVERLIKNTINEKKVQDFFKDHKTHTKEELEQGNLQKKGLFTGRYAIDPFNKGRKMPIWLANFALMDFGTGIIRCSAHDFRDYEFAQKYKIQLTEVVERSDRSKPVNAHENKGVLKNSGPFTGKNISPKLIHEIVTWIEKQGFGKKEITYHLRDWLISRQRYWGAPIPIIYCDDCGTVPVPEKELPVVLPYVENFRPTGTGISPLASDENFYKVKCPKCGKEARRETDVSDTFLDSAWYFLRYTSTEENSKAWLPARVKKWLPVNTYIGGAEHSVLHLLYSRFLTMVLKDIGLIEGFEEPFTKFRAHGLIIAEGAKMSKSKGNVVNPDAYIEEYGVDTLRLYLMFIGPYELGGDFRDQAISGPRNFLKRVWEMQGKLADNKLPNENKQMMNKTIEKVSDDIPKLKFNTAIASLMEWLNFLSKRKSITGLEYKTFLKLLAPFAPHISEELWRNMFDKNVSIHLSKWPEIQENILVEEEIMIPVQVNGKFRATIRVNINDLKETDVIEQAVKEERVKKYVEGKKYKVIYVKGKIVNFVTA